MFVVTQTHVQFVVPNVIKHKILTEFYYNFACFNPPLCVSLACFSPCDDWTAFSILFGHFSTNGLLCLLVKSYWAMFDCSGCGTSSPSSASVQWDWTVTALKNFEVLGSILQHWFCDRNLETFLSPPPLYPNLEAQGSRTWEESKTSEDLALPMNTTVTLWTDR